MPPPGPMDRQSCTLVYSTCGLPSTFQTSTAERGPAAEQGGRMYPVFPGSSRKPLPVTQADGLRCSSHARRGHVSTSISVALFHWAEGTARSPVRSHLGIIGARPSANPTKSAFFATLPKRPGRSAARSRPCAAQLVLRNYREA